MTEEMRVRRIQKKRPELFDRKARIRIEKLAVLKRAKFLSIMKMIKKPGIEIKVRSGERAKIFLRELTWTANKISEKIAQEKMAPKNKVEFPERLIITYHPVGEKRHDGCRPYEARYWRFEKAGNKIAEGTNKTYVEIKVREGRMEHFWQWPNGRRKYFNETEKTTIPAHHD